mmetsp:Transcript_29139/g.53664  ORF Transcript_29139/g.53664 Transcript_29139/m.53664 type:complete len:383 (-) Transcript_29139:594-1742(-)
MVLLWCRRWKGGRSGTWLCCGFLTSGMREALPQPLDDRNTGRLALFSFMNAQMPITQTQDQLNGGCYLLQMLQGRRLTLLLRREYPLTLRTSILRGRRRPNTVRKVAAELQQSLGVCQVGDEVSIALCLAVVQSLQVDRPFLCCLVDLHDVLFQADWEHLLAGVLPGKVVQKSLGHVDGKFALAPVWQAVQLKKPGQRRYLLQVACRWSAGKPPAVMTIEIPERLKLCIAIHSLQFVEFVENYPAPPELLEHRKCQRHRISHSFLLVETLFALPANLPRAHAEASCVPAQCAKVHILFHNSCFTLGCRLGFAHTRKLMQTLSIRQGVQQAVRDEDNVSIFADFAYRKGLELSDRLYRHNAQWQPTFVAKEFVELADPLLKQV